MKAFLFNGTDGVKSIPLSRLTPDQLRWGLDSDGGADLLTLYEKIPWLYRGVMARRNALVSMPYNLHRGDENGEIVKESVLPFECDLHDIIDTYAFHLILFGAAYGFKGLNVVRRVKEFRMLHPTTITPEYDNDKGLVGFTRRIGGQSLPINVDEMVYLWAKPHRKETGPGTSDAAVAVQAAGVLFYMDAYGNRYFAGGANNNTLILLPEATQDDERKRVQNWIDRTVGGVKNAFKILAVTAKEIKTVTLGTTPKELVIPEITASKREDIATALGVPQTMLFSSAANFATARQDDLHFYDKTVKPDAYLIEKTLNKGLFNPLGYTLAFHPEQMEIYQQLEAQKAQGVVTLYRGGVMTVEESRKYIGLPEIPTGTLLDVSGMGLGNEQLPVASHQSPATTVQLTAKSHQSPVADSRQPTADSHDHALTVEQTEAYSGELKRWKVMATTRYKENKPEKARDFKSVVLPPALTGAIKGALEVITDSTQLAHLFDSALDWQGQTS